MAENVQETRPPEPPPKPPEVPKPTERSNRSENLADPNESRQSAWQDIRNAARSEHTAAKTERDLTAGETGVGAGSGPWFDEGTNHRDGGAVQQTTDGSCVSASGEMLTDGRVTQAELLSELGDWSNLSALRDELNKHDGEGTWTGHYFQDGGEALRQASEGPMAAQVQAPFGRAHMVILEPGENGSFTVRDPNEGSSYDVDGAWVEKYVSGGVFR
ncbi:hypothetical protein AB0M36_06450 [Actinoplanes sp. NPDC051346]|uniref:hypothetical protein n=1 Tax=Actinoplanes sp. NPDC051346 TaxID=3155048 RepID=UPI00344573CE